MSSNLAGGMASFEETIRQIMEEQVTRLGKALEARIEISNIEVSRDVVAIEHGLRVEREERERSMIALQRDMLTLTDSAVKERSLIEKVMQDLGQVQAQHAELMSRSACPIDGSLGDSEAFREGFRLQVAELYTMMTDVRAIIPAQTQEMSDTFEKSLAQVKQEIEHEQTRSLRNLERRFAELASASRTAALSDVGGANAQGSELQDISVLQHLRHLQQQMFEQFSEFEAERETRGRVENELSARVSALLGEVQNLKEVSATVQFNTMHAGCGSDSSLDALQGKTDELQMSCTRDIQAFREDVQKFRQIDSTRLNELCSTAFIRLEETQENHSSKFSELHIKLDSFQECVDRFSKIASAEREDQQKSFAELRESLANTIGDSAHRIELLEGDLIGLTSALKRLDTRVKEVAKSITTRSANSSAGPSPLSAVLSSAMRPAAAISPQKAFDTDAPCSDSRGPLASLLDAADLAGQSDAAQSDASMANAQQQLRMDLIRRAAGSNPELNSMLRRALELGEI
jgi:hypothetical protein